MKGKEGCSDNSIAFTMEDAGLGPMAGEGCDESISVGNYGEVCFRDVGCFGNC